MVEKDQKVKKDLSDSLPEGDTSGLTQLLEPSESQGQWIQSSLSTVELKRRRREILSIFFISFLLAILVGVEVYIFRTSKTLPTLYALFFIGLVNVNIVLVLLLFFLIFRNLVKVFVERRNKIFGHSLKTKLIAAFTSFSAVPTILVFVISVFYINSSFEKWFSNRMIGILKNASEVIDSFISNEKRRNYDFAHLLAKEVQKMRSEKQIHSKLQELAKNYRLDAVEYYPQIFGERFLYMSKEMNLPAVPPASLEFLQKGLVSKDEVSTIHQLGDYNVLRVIVPVDKRADRGALVLSKFLILSPNSKINDIVGAYQEVRDNSLIEYPIKSIYMVMLFLMTLVILFAATWFGFYLAKQLAIPLVQLGQATKRIADGDYTPLKVQSGSDEITSLVASFNQMTENLSASEIELQQTLRNLNQHSRYVEVVLGNVSTGVISVDQMGRITTINRRASDLLKIDPQAHLGKSARELLTIEYFRTFSEMLKQIQENQLSSIIREIRVNVRGESIPLLLTLSLLKDESGQELGKVLVFDDLTPIMNAQRAAAWTEVARRIAHEVKNPLTPIKLAAERLQRKFGSEITDPAFKECTLMIIKQVEDMKNLVNEFSQFARLPQAKPVPTDLHKVIEESLTIFTQAHSQVRFATEFDPQLPLLKIDPDQIKRVLVNLVDNAVAAQQKTVNGEVLIGTKFDAELKLARIFVSDQGDGIPAKDRSRIFEPYFTTKEGGTGLGLAIVKRIIEDHNGFVRAQANEPKGTTILIELPAGQNQDWNPSPTGVV